ncbi:unnamed protein product [Urochloa humidicola]
MLSAPHECSSTPPSGLTPAATTTTATPATTTTTKKIPATSATTNLSSLVEELPGRVAEDSRSLEKGEAEVDKTVRDSRIPAAEKGKGIADCGVKASEATGKALKTGTGTARACGPAAGDPGTSHRGAKPLSYRDAVMRPRTFKPRFPRESSHQEKQAWLHELSWKEQRGAAISVWERLGATELRVPSILERLSVGHSNHSDGSHLLALLRAKAGDRRCFNCFASDHRISQCRDPPRCLTCSRSGHKARDCPRRRAAAYQAVVKRYVRGAPAALQRRVKEGAQRAVQFPSASQRQEEGDRRREEEGRRRMDPLECPPGDTSLRPRAVLAAAPRTQAIRDEERDLELHTLVAVQRDAHVPLTCADVLRDAPRQLRIPQYELGVEGLSKATFLLRFASPAARNAALAIRSFAVANSELNIMPWSRRIGARVGKLRYRARVCLEGVPRHARNAAAIAQLFSNPSFVDEVNCPVEKEEARFCFNVWVWTDAPTDLACKVLIHLDRVLDYTPPSASQGRSSFECDISGIPDYPEKFDFDWFLGVPDGDRPITRPPVRARLGGTGDRSPPRGGDGGGFEFRQRPPASRFDGARMLGARRRDGGAGSSGRYGGRRRAGQVDSRMGEQEAGAGKAGQVWRPKFDQTMGKVSGKLLLNAEDSFHSHVSVAQYERLVDPMEEEANRTTCPSRYQSAVAQRSVEPTVPNVDLVPHAIMDGEFGSDGLATAMKGCTLPERAGTVHSDNDRVISTTSLDFEVVLPADENRADKDIETDISILDVAQIEQVMQELQVREEIAELSGLRVTDQQQVQGQQYDGTLHPVAVPAMDQIEARPERGSNSIGPKEVVGPVHSQLGGPQALPIDLNSGPPEEQTPEKRSDENGLQLAGHLDHDRLVLGEANARLNKEHKDMTSHKAQGKGISRFAIPLKKALLCPPVLRPKACHLKKPLETTVSMGSDRRAARSQRTTTGLITGSLDEKASAMLLRWAGLLVQNEAPTEAARHQFAQEFVQPACLELVGNMRATFGLPEGGGAGPLEVLAIDADA